MTDHLALTIPQTTSTTAGMAKPTKGATKLIRRSITRRSFGLNMIVGLGGLHSARGLTGSGWLSPRSGQLAKPVVLYNSVLESFPGTWKWADNGGDGSTLINRQLQFIIKEDTNGDMTFGLVQSQIGGCTQQDIWDATGEWIWQESSDELDFNCSGFHYQSFSCSPSQNNKTAFSALFKFPSIQIGATAMSLDPSGPDALSLKDLNTFQPLRNIILTKTAATQPQAWGNWERLDGSLTQGVAAASWDENRLDVFSAGVDQALYHKSWGSSVGWSSWERLGGTISGKPAAASWGEGRLDICVVGSGNAVWHLSFDNGTWAGWESLGGNDRVLQFAGDGPGPDRRGRCGRLV
jgi:hypothetical protein